MRTISLDAAHLDAFMAYCRAHAAEHDSSNYPDPATALDADHPTCLALEDDILIGACSLLRGGQYAQASKGRILIWHSLFTERPVYDALLTAILPGTAGLDYLYGFIPRERERTAAIWESLGWFIERRSYLMRYDKPETPDSLLPAGYELRQLQAYDQDLASFSDLINLNFARLAGHVDSDPQRIASFLTDPYYLPGGILVLCCGNQPIGTLGLSHDENEAGVGGIEMLSLHPDYRGRGLGRALLAEGIRRIRAAGYPVVDLSVNAENDTAVRLYTSSGFMSKQVLLCYRLNLPAELQSS
ncbi:MAG: GNAT family N-acetyltransferase [Anaerolineae bacterium]